MKVFYVMVLVLVAGAVPSLGRTESESTTVFNKTQPHESMNNATVSSSELEMYTSLVLAMQWPKSFCGSSINGGCQPQIPDPNRFTVHGLWPQYQRKGVDCRRISGYQPFDGQKLRRNRRLESRLNYYWPDLRASQGHNQGFWGHEYEKHGSCTFKNQADYFGLTIIMVERLGNLTGKLSRIRGGPNIIPGYWYSPRKIEYAVSEVTNVRPVLSCIKVGNIQYLLEIRFCAYRNGGLKSCPEGSNSCWNDRVYFPKP